MVKNDHFLPLFDQKTSFFRIFWHPENPPSKTPFLADLPLPTLDGVRAAETPVYRSAGTKTKFSEVTCIGHSGAIRKVGDLY